MCGANEVSLPARARRILVLLQSGHVVKHVNQLQKKFNDPIKLEQINPDEGLYFD